MSKNIYEVLNNVEIDLEELKNEEFNDIDRSRAKKSIIRKLKHNKNQSQSQNNNKKKYIGIASVIIFSVCLLNNNFISYAKEIIEDIGYNISNALGLPYNLEDYTDVINKSITKNGIEITLNEVVLNNDEINFTYTAKGEEKLSELGYENFMLRGISINNKDISAAAGAAMDYIDDYTSKGVVSATLFGIEEDELKGDVNIKVEFDLLSDNKVKGKPWVFKFKANGKQLALDTEEIYLNKVIQLENGASINLEKYTKNSMGEKIYATIDNYEEGKYYDIKIKGKDEDNNEIIFSMGRCSAEKPILERLHPGKDLDNIKFSVYVAEVEAGYMAFNSDFKKVSDEFTIE